MGKHEYEDTGVERNCGVWPAYLKCKHCGRVSGLDAWQLREMPIEMARCPDSPVRIGFWEWWSGKIDCSA